MNNLDNLLERKIDKLLLDTHVLIWYLEGIKLSDDQVKEIEKARNNNELYISAISIWEISLLVAKEKIVLSISINEWLSRVRLIRGLKILDLSLDILVESCNLMHYTHKDPADRMIISSARDINAHLLTYDEKILDYSSKGYLRTC